MTVKLRSTNIDFNRRLPFVVDGEELPFVGHSKVWRDKVRSLPVERRQWVVSGAAPRTEPQLFHHFVVGALHIETTVVAVTHAGNFISAICGVEIAARRDRRFCRVWWGAIASTKRIVLVIIIPHQLRQ